MTGTPLSRHQHPVYGLAILLPQGRATEVRGCVRKCMVHRQHDGRDARQRHRPAAHRATRLLPQPIDRHVCGGPTAQPQSRSCCMRTWPQQMVRTVWRTGNRWSAHNTCALQYRHVPRLPAMSRHMHHMRQCPSSLHLQGQGSYCGGLHEPRLDRGWKGLQGRHTKSQHDLCDMRNADSVCKTSSSVSANEVCMHRYVTGAHLQQVRDDSHLQSQAIALSL